MSIYIQNLVSFQQLAHWGGQAFYIFASSALRFAANRRHIYSSLKLFKLIRVANLIEDRIV